MDEKSRHRSGKCWIIASAFAFGLALITACAPSASTVPPGPRYFSNLSYDSAAARFRREAEKQFEAKDISYPLSLLNCAVTSFYAGNLKESKQAFSAAYKIDDGNIPEAAKFYQWLVVDSRKVYRFTKRERELVHLYLGLCYLAENNLPEALVEFKKLRQMDQDASKLPVVNFYMGLVYEKLQLYDDALIEYRGLADMPGTGIDATSLIRRVEMLKAGMPEATNELVVHVDHHSEDSFGRTVVYADNRPVAELPPYSDRFDVRLTEAEASRKALQKASAEATRTGLRCCGTVLAEYLFPRHGEAIGDLAGDLVLGDERADQDKRAWGYAPTAIAVARLALPSGTNEVRLEFFGPQGLLGSCVYPLSGRNRRAALVTGSRTVTSSHPPAQGEELYFITAGLAKEFYEY